MIISQPRLVTLLKSSIQELISLFILFLTTALLLIFFETTIENLSSKSPFSLDFIIKNGVEIIRLPSNLIPLGRRNFLLSIDFLSSLGNSSFDDFSARVASRS